MLCAVPYALMCPLSKSLCLITFNSYESYDMICCVPLALGLMSYAPCISAHCPTPFAPFYKLHVLCAAVAAVFSRTPVSPSCNIVHTS